jgi:hypothetical protein
LENVAANSVWARAEESNVVKPRRMVQAGHTALTFHEHKMCFEFWLVLLKKRHHSGKVMLKFKFHVLTEARMKMAVLRDL